MSSLIINQNPCPAFACDVGEGTVRSWSHRGEADDHPGSFLLNRFRKEGMFGQHPTPHHHIITAGHSVGRRDLSYVKTLPAPWSSTPSGQHLRGVPHRVCAVCELEGRGMRTGRFSRACDPCRSQGHPGFVIIRGRCGQGWTEDGGGAGLFSWGTYTFCLLLCCSAACMRSEKLGHVISCKAMDD